MTDPKTEPLPCPHCGAMVIAVFADPSSNFLSVSMCCPSCLARGPEVLKTAPLRTPKRQYSSADRAAAIAEWNRRA